MKKKVIFLSLFFTSILIFSCCSLNYDDVVAQYDDHRIYLYGESHGNQLIMTKELELWEDYYLNQGFRHLFLEVGYCDAQLLNLWMQTNDDSYLQVILVNFAATVNNGTERAEQNKWFYNEIKSRCPQTIFHGTDVQHQWQTGVYYQDYLKSIGRENSEEYVSATKSIESCDLYYLDNGKRTDETFRENYMISRFEEEFDALPSSTKIMGIYGAQHTRFGKKNVSKEVDNMCTQLASYYLEREGPIIFTQDISELKL